MKKLILAVLPFYLLPLFLHITTILCKPIYTAVEDITVNCGSHETSLNENDDRYWTSDINSKLSPTESHQANTNTTSQVRNASSSPSATQVPYTTARLSRSEFTYKFPLTTGQKFVRLYFYPTSYGPGFDRSKALFSVRAGGFTLLHDFNASVTADADEVETLRREFCMNIDEGQSLSITFTPSRAIPDAYAFINGIEIVSMPPNLYYTASESPGVDYVGNENSFLIENSTAMEMVYRLNIGGSTISLNQDTGMYRKWDSLVEEQKYLDAMSYTSTALPQNISIQLKFVKIPEYSAPKEVYQTGRSMGKNHTRNKSFKLTWEFPVDPQFLYLLRLHFCEFESLITESQDRLFLIYVANQLAEPRADIIMWSGGNGIPVYRDFVVFVPGGADHKKVTLFLALQANPRDYMTSYNDVLLNGVEIFKLNDTNGNLAGPNPDPRTPGPAPPKSPLKDSKKKSTSMFAVVAGVVSGMFVLTSVLGFCVFRRGRRAKDTSGSNLPSGLCREFTLKEIKAATKTFNKDFIIGSGGFGYVYKGNIGRDTAVAIKRLKPESQQGALEFKTEIDMLSQLRHQHLVSLIGYCRDGNEMILVYEYMENGTLSEHLYESNQNPSCLPWEQRLQICIGAARGLHYLHTGGANGTIIHRDVKSTNILLDEKMVAKVSDFGLSKMGSITMSKTHITTMVKGSYGYLDPEYMLRNQLTEKSDVYSFGVVMCEVLCARPALIRTVEKKQMSLADWFRTCHRNGELDQIIDPSLKGKIADACFNKFVELAISCMHENGMKRPSMNDVVEGLELALQLQQGGDKGDVDYGKKGEIVEVVCMNASDAGFSWTSDSKNSRATNNSSEQSSTTSESIKGMSGTVFSEIKDPTGR